MPFTGDSFSHLFDWEKDPQRQEKIVNARLEAEFDGVDTGLGAVAARATVLEGYARREVLTSSRDYFFRTDGSDSNTGTADSAGGSFLTIQKALNTALGLDMNGFALNLRAGGSGARTFTAGFSVARPFLGGIPSLIGDTTTPSNVLVSTTSATAMSIANGANLNIGGFKLATTTSGNGLNVTNGCTVTCDGLMEFGAVAGSAITAFNASFVTFTANYAVNGSQGRHTWLSGFSLVSIANRTITLTGTPAWATEWVLANAGAYYFAQGATFSGAATGQRYEIDTNAVVNTGGGGATFLPGNVAGSALTGGQYI